MFVPRVVRMVPLIALLALGRPPAAARRLSVFATLPDHASVSTLQIDSTGNLYLAGSIQPGDPRSETDSTDVFVAKLSPDGSQLLYWTVFGGSDSDSAQALAVDSWLGLRDGNNLVTGFPGHAWRAANGLSS
jgi:hypothetical protein